MRVQLLATDSAELRALGTAPEEALERGLAALGRRATHDRLREPGGTERGLAELRDLFAEMTADMRVMRYLFATKAPGYRSSSDRFDAVEHQMRRLRRDLVPGLRRELRTLRAREALLARELAWRGRDPDAIGPHVPPGEAMDPSPKPGEGPEERYTLSPLPPRRSLLDRLLGRRRA
jgi:hypothetical protein